MTYLVKKVLEVSQTFSDKICHSRTTKYSNCIDSRCSYRLFPMLYLFFSFATMIVIIVVTFFCFFFFFFFFEQYNVVVALEIFLD